MEATQSPIKPNPNGVNQFRPDPRWERFLSRYFDPQSPTYSKGCQSAREAGYKEKYAKNILNKNRKRLVTFGEKSSILSALEASIDAILDMETKQPIFVHGKPIIDDKTGEMIVQHDANLVEVVLKLTMFAAERLDPERWGKKVVCSGCRRISFRR